MKINVWCFSLLLLTILSFIHVTQSSSPPSISFLGISPQDEKYFKAEIIKCKNGSKKFTKAQLNDDYCDCPDGTDEPGTSACPQGKFYCRNAGHLPILLFSSRVNDGICDCCDGSDEYDDKVKCPNTCWEAGKLARDKLKKKIEMYQEGITIRKQEVEKAIQAVAKDEVELAKLKNDEKILKVSVKQLKVRKEKIEKAEDRERLQREKEEKMKEAATEKYEAENKSDDEEEALNTSDDDKIGLLDDPPSDQHEKDGPESTEGLSREELGRLVASRWTGGKTGLLGEGIDTAKDDHGGNNEIPGRIYHNDHDDSAPKQNEANQKNGEDDMEDSIDEKFVGDDLDGSHAPHKPDSEDQKDLSDMKTLSSSSWLGKIKETVRNLLQSANSFPTPVDKLEADRVRKEYDDSSTRLSEVESRISSLTEKLKQNFGVEKEFYSFYDHCYEIKKNTYVYKVCPFKEATQEEGYSKTQLGHWEKFENSYRIMLFSNGHGCWNGPDRSLKVKLRCGLKTELTDVDEPSRCEYVALMSTPAVCVEGKLKELKHKLESMNKQPQSHDEL